MFNIFFPNAYAETAYEIPYEMLYQSGIRGLLFDIDNTLTEHGKPATEHAITLMKHLKEMGFSVCLISNNKEERVKKFAAQVQTEYIYKAGKPKKAGYVAAMQKIGTARDTTVFVGDQLFTDVFGAKNAGIYAYLVSPIDKKEEIQIIIKRWLEKPILFFYKREMKRQIQQNEK